MIYRSRDDIIRVILDAVNGSAGGIVKTKLMYQAYLGHDQMKEYQTVLTESGLLNYEVDTQKFKTTEKGRRFLEAYDQINRMIKARPATNLGIIADEESRSYRAMSTWI